MKAAYDAWLFAARLGAAFMVNSMAAAARVPPVGIRATGSGPG